MKRYIATFLNRQSMSQVIKMGIIGVGNTVIYFIVFNVLRELGLGLRPANIVSFILGTALAYVMNRKWTFNANTAAGSWRKSAKFFAVNALALLVTDQIVLFAANRYELTRIGENIALVVASGLILLPKFATYRDLVFRTGDVPHSEDDVSLSG